MPRTIRQDTNPSDTRLALFYTIGMFAIPENLVAEICQRFGSLPPHQPRLMVAVAGPPASGKSTLADQLFAEIDQVLNDTVAAVLPMDGFHLDNTVLDEMDARARKGAPHTFDLDGFSALLQRVASTEGDVIVPVFDRSLDLARAGGRKIRNTHRVVIVEGNYLLLDRPGWKDLRKLFDYTVYLDVSEAELSKRLLQRWLDYGLTPEAAKERADSNDMPNAQLVVAARLAADRTV